MNRYSALIPVLMLVMLAACAVSHRSGVYHTVLRGQTLYTISRVYGVNEQYLARINGIADPTQLQVGEKIYIPNATEVKTVPVTVRPQPEPPRPTPEPPAQRKPPTVVRKPVDPSPMKTTPTPAAQKSPPAASGKFIWPVKGEIVRTFGSNTSKGLEIAVATGTPVASAAAGKVIYSGSGITGYGNLVIVRHDDSFFTVYGYNQKNLVSAGAFVSKGEKIAYAGTPPSGGRSRVYFEIRYGKKPVNPLTYLP